MAVTAQRSITIQFSGDFDAANNFAAANNAASPSQVEVVDLASGANTISPPDVVPTGLTIIPPSGNTHLITLKGVAGDTGIPLHLTDPTSIALDSTFTSLVLNAADVIADVRLVWS
jgi:hypothetical protein